MTQSLSTTRLSAARDDLLTSENTGTSNFDTTVNSVKRKLLTKKKSLELSLENIKILKNRSNSNSSMQSNPQITPKKCDKLINSVSEYSVLQKSSLLDSIPNEINEEKAHNETDSSILKDGIESHNESKYIDVNNLFPDIENEFHTDITNQENQVENKNKWAKFTNNKYKIILVSIFIYYYISIPTFFNGFFIGVFITSLVSFIYFKLNFNSFHLKNEITCKKGTQHEINNQHKFLVVEKSDKNFCGVYKVRY